MKKAIIGIVVFILLMIGLTFIYAEAQVSGSPKGSTIIQYGGDGYKDVLEKQNQKEYFDIVNSKECMGILEVKISLQEFDDCIYLLRHDKRMSKEQRTEIHLEALQKLHHAEKVCHDKQEDKLNILRKKYLGADGLGESGK